MITLTQLRNKKPIHLNIDRIVFVEPGDKSDWSIVGIGFRDDECVSIGESCQQVLKKIEDARYVRAHTFGDGFKEGVYGKGKYPGSIRVSCL